MAVPAAHVLPTAAAATATAPTATPTVARRRAAGWLPVNALPRDPTLLRWLPLLLQVLLLLLMACCWCPTLLPARASRRSPTEEVQDLKLTEAAPGALLHAALLLLIEAV
jgi:hypothetical protein